MGYDHHFLSRLERVDEGHAQLALALFYDSELVRLVLERAPIPPAAERVAISLDDPRFGPYVVVTRKGDFVTCLARGMAAVSLPVVTRAKLDEITAQAEHMRERRRVAEALVAQRGGMAAVLERIGKGGENVTRSEIAAIASWQPLFRVDMLCQLSELARYLEEARGLLAPHARRRPRAELAQELREYWFRSWAAAHLGVLVALDAPKVLDDIVAFSAAQGKPLEPRAGPLLFAYALEHCGLLPLVLRGLWGIARFGERLLPVFEERFANVWWARGIVDTAIALAAIALRFPHLEKRVRRAFAAPPGPRFSEARNPEASLTCRSAIGELAVRVFDNPRYGLAFQQRLGARWLAAIAPFLPEDHPSRFERAEDVPAPLALTYAANARFDPRASKDGPLYELMFLPWLVQAEAEDLYLPPELVKAISVPWTPEAAQEMLDQDFEALGPGTTLRAEPKTPRNAPCPCGSGRKFKQCCGPRSRTPEPAAEAKRA
jgi:hypothetical protein